MRQGAINSAWVIVIFLVFGQIVYGSEAENSLQFGKLLFNTASDDLINESPDKKQIRHNLDESLYHFSCLESGRERYYWQARAEYIYGIAEQKANRKIEGETHFLAALDSAEKALEYGEFSEGLRILADIYAQLLPYNGLIYKIRNGRKIIELSEKAIKLDPENVKARLTLAVSYLHAPPIAGGSVDRSISMLLDVKRIGGSTRSERFFTDAWLATAYAKDKDRTNARYYARQALTLYPGNGWMQMLLKEN